MYRLLIVDDEYEIRNGISSYFPWDELGFAVVGDKENGQEALEFLGQQQVDVILTDIKMPVMSGLELARELHNRNDRTKIVFLTGHKDFELVKEALIYGARDYVVKPTKYKELAQVFTKLKEELDREQGGRKTVPEGAGAGQAAAGSDVLVARIKAYVDENYKDAGLKDVARIVHMNPYYVSSYFKKKTGSSFSDYLISVKMGKAAEFLADPSYRTYEISDLVGYSNPKNFSKTFKAFYGKNPRDFRHEGPGEE
ncbi:MAG: two component transcriptional regulator, AraC family [Paenibacillaceae bacterium]|nr:two component transcriptional regulator, AraC family [Paenibacillaceae bacterium]